MWEPDILDHENGTIKYRIKEFGKALTYKQWIEALKTSEGILSFFNGMLKNNPYQAFFWEVKPIAKNYLDAPFEFVIIESAALATVTADSTSFRKYFKDGAEVVHFFNLGGDAHLIVPTGLGNKVNYAHLGEFVRNAPATQVINFWKMVGLQYENQMGSLPKWLSTAGLGVFWLHVRIDSRPKYYRYKPYQVYTPNELA